MDLVRSWLAAIGGYLLGMWLASLLARAGGDQGAYAGFLGRLLWLYLPLLVAYAVIGGAAAAAHTRPGRLRRGRHLVAVLPIPVAAIVLSTVMSAISGVTGLGGVVLSIVFAVAGGAAGVVLADLAWLRFTRDTGYF